MKSHKIPNLTKEEKENTQKPLPTTAMRRDIFL